LAVAEELKNPRNREVENTRNSVSIVKLASDLVAIDSVNPSLVPGGAGEGAVAGFLATWLRRAGFDVELTEVAPNRPNVVALADGNGSGPTRLLCGHTDTVGVEGMAAPFDPVVRDGRLYGRGSQDMKGGLAAMATAAADWLCGGRRGAGRVIVAAVADEEYASLGADACAARWRADEAVITEPTDLAIGVAHKGFSCAEITVHGRAAHGSRPRDGRDAIMAMGRVLRRLEALDGLLQSGAPHSRLGVASLHAGRIHGGTELSVYPARAVLEMERRTLPGEPIDVAVSELQAIAREIAIEDPEFHADVRLLLARPAYETPGDALVINRMASAVRARLGSARVEGVSFWTDAAILGAAGTPTVLFGPRGAGLHSHEEHVVVDDLSACADVLRLWLES
jgi:acetylornithine deacetylase/succinyl-diaminopimelate desuccinylase-like protein